MRKTIKLQIGFMIIFLFFSNCTELKKMIYSYDDYCNLLSKYSDYDTITNSTVRITYDNSSKGLIKLKQNYKLDTIGQNLNETERIIAIMKWLNNYLEYDFGYDGKPEKLISKPRNAEIILQNKNNDKIAKVCRDFGIVLCELYLSIGLKSRYITCHSGFTNDCDAHVVTEVYCDELEKWIMVDGAMNAYIKDTNGTILNLKEIRKKFIQKEKLIVNNDVKQITTDDYLKYMSKNTFKFSRCTDSKFNAEETTEKWLMLLPKNFVDTEYSNTQNFIITNTDKEFWK